MLLNICYQALSQNSASPRKTQTDNPKYTFRTWLLRLGMTGDEFKTAKLHLLKNLEGDSAFRNGQTSGWALKPGSPGEEGATVGFSGVTRVTVGINPLEEVG